MPKHRRNREWFECCVVSDCPTWPHPDLSKTVPICAEHAKAIASEVRAWSWGPSTAPHHVVSDKSQRRMDRQRVERADVQQAQSQVYYIRIGDHVKIGFTGNVVERLIGLRVDSSALLATEPGGRDLERQRHLQFGQERVGRRENFNPSRRLLAHIETIKQEHGEPTVTGYVKVSSL